ncbi:MAG TPA: protein kinase [Candidatus Limnocylindrales bacterium]|nr:protein kinase [Candidatus Limnocylindrales bacterium]
MDHGEGVAARADCRGAVVTPERWVRIKTVFQETSELQPSERESYLSEQTADDPELRREVEQMLLHATGAGLLDRPAWEELGSRKELHMGDRVGPYEILGNAGTGGMARVYKARDTRLDRTVAIKVLSAEFSHRLRTEGRAISALNHPHVCALYDIGDREGYLVMEYVEGESLAECLKRGALPVSSVLRCGSQIADALAAAHNLGIVHRDLKPANIMITATGVKVLDFGVAQMARDGSSAGGFAGTQAYMSPSQLNGNPADARSDIFALGLVLHEMATGKRYRRGDAVSLPGGPPALAGAIEACLQEDDSARVQSMDALRSTLDQIRAELDRPKRPRRRRWPWAAAAAVGLALRLGIVGWRLLTPPPLPEISVKRPTIVTPLEQSSVSVPSPPKPPSLVTLAAYEGSMRDPALSPDGRKVAFSWSRSGQRHAIFVRDVESAQAVTQLTEGADDDWGPAWSPDGRKIAFRRHGPQWEIDSVPASGGLPAVLAEISPPNQQTLPQLAWSRDGKWIVAPDGKWSNAQLYLFNVASGERRALTHNEDGIDHAPAFSPDGRRLAYASCDKNGNPCNVAVVTLSRDMTPRAAQILVRNTFVRGLAWTPDGRSLVYSAGAGFGSPSWLWRVSLSPPRPPERIDLGGAQARHPSMPRTGELLAFTRIGSWRLMMIENFR